MSMPKCKTLKRDTPEDLDEAFAELMEDLAAARVNPQSVRWQYGVAYDGQQREIAYTVFVTWLPLNLPPN